jgi:hypothetical protein
VNLRVSENQSPRTCLFVKRRRDSTPSNPRCDRLVLLQRTTQRRRSAALQWTLPKLQSGRLQPATTTASRRRVGATASRACDTENTGAGRKSTSKGVRVCVSVCALRYVPILADSTATEGEEGSLSDANALRSLVSLCPCLGAEASTQQSLDTDSQGCTTAVRHWVA